jgi:hypothetical protein
LEVAREQKKQTVQDQIDVNKLTRPASGRASCRRSKEKGWKACQYGLGVGKDQKQNKSRGYSFGRDEQ